MSSPALTVFIPSYNYAPFLKEALDSVLSQTFEDYELLVIDDGSTDGSDLILKEYAAKDPRIRPYFHTRNVGIFTTAQEALQLARGVYLHCFSADDYLLPEFFAKSMAQFTLYPAAQLVCSNVGYFTTIPQEAKSHSLLPQVKGSQFFAPDSLLDLYLTTSFSVPGSTCIVKKELLLKTYGFLDPHLENLSDWFLFNQIALFEGVVYLPETLLVMRQHAHTYTAQVKTNKVRRRQVYSYLLNILSLKENYKVREKFKQAGLLTFIFRELFWKLLLNPRYLDFWPYVNRKYPLINRFVPTSFRKRRS